MATINVRLDDHIRDALEQKASDAGVSLSDYVRNLLRSDIVPVREEREYTPQHLTAIDRRMLSLLHRVLARVRDDSLRRFGHVAKVERQRARPESRQRRGRIYALHHLDIQLARGFEERRGPVGVGGEQDDQTSRHVWFNYSGTTSGFSRAT